MPEAEFLAGVKSLRAGPGSPLGGQEIDVPGRQALEPKNGSVHRDRAGDRPLRERGIAI